LGREMSTGQEALAVLYGWKVNRGSDVALAIHHRLCDVSSPAVGSV